jgi:hypothetical protein
VPDTTGRVPPASAREGADASDVFLRAPWEIWRTPHGPARYHREAHVLLPTEAERFESGDISVYAPDGSDVRVDYESIDLGKGSQSNETISVSVYRLKDSFDSAWSTAVDRFKRRWQEARPAQAFPVPDRHPAATRQLAFISQPKGADSRFVQLTMFQEGAWAVQYEIACQVEDVEVARERTRWFLRSLRP